MSDCTGGILTVAVPELGATTSRFLSACFAACLGHCLYISLHTCLHTCLYTRLQSYVCNQDFLYNWDFLVKGQPQDMSLITLCVDRKNCEKFSITSNPETPKIILHIWNMSARMSAHMSTHAYANSHLDHLLHALIDCAIVAHDHFKRHITNSTDRLPTMPLSMADRHTI